MIDRFQTFTVLITKISRSIRRIKTEAMVEFDLKSPHASCIHYLYPNKQLTLSELCEICEEDKGAVSRSIKYLVKKGYVEYLEQENKKYKNRLILTDKGRKVGDFIMDKLTEILTKTGDSIGDDMSMFYKCLEIISDNLENVATNCSIKEKEL